MAQANLAQAKSSQGDAFAAGTRERQSLDGAWQFSHENGLWRDAVVPGPWQAQFADLVDSSGKAVYKRRFALPQGWQGREIALQFGAVSYFCDVLLNGQILGSHEGGYLPFEFVLPTDRLGADNEIEVRVTLPTGDTSLYPDYPFAETPHGKQSWYGPLGGIWAWSVALGVAQIQPRRLVQAAMRVCDEQRFGMRLLR